MDALGVLLVVVLLSYLVSKSGRAFIIALVIFILLVTCTGCVPLDLVTSTTFEDCVMVASEISEGDSEKYQEYRAYCAHNKPLAQGALDESN